MRVFLALLIIGVAPEPRISIASPPPRSEGVTPVKEALLPSKPRPEVRTGIYYGYVEYIAPDGRLIGVKPYAKQGRGTPFVVDRQTQFRRERTTVRREQLKIGDKVAVRYFAEGNVAVAEAVFLVEGEFVPANYQKPRPKPPQVSPPKKGSGH